MALYFYTGFNNLGTSENGSVDAASEKLAFDTLQARGITVASLGVKSTHTGSKKPWYLRDISFGSSQLSFEDQAVTSELLSALIAADLPLSEAVRVAALTSENTSVRQHFERVGQRMADGENFATAFEEENKLFSPIFVSFLKVSDTSNSLPSLLKELSAFFRKHSQIRQKIVSALIYPSILIAASILLLGILIFYLAPNLEPLFLSADKEPPATVSVLLNANNLVRNHWVLLTLLSGALLMLPIILLSSAKLRSYVSMGLYRLPLYGANARLADLLRLTQATDLLIASGQPLSEALRSASQIAGSSSFFSDQFREAADHLESGLRASLSLETNKYLPKEYVELFRIGEETNSLPSSLKALSNTMSSQIDRQMQRMLSLITPIITLVIGLGIGLLIYTIMGAILEVNNLAF